ncbi:MAG TPA: glycosyltransferase family 2 protein [Phenylobacterium sp.]
MGKSAAPRLAMVMIARDEARCVGRALESVARHVDQMIVLDTGSTDQTREIARAKGAQVFEFAWCDDFAAARNAALALSDADWNLIVDADEWLDGDASPLAALPAGGGFVGQVRVLSETNGQGVEGIGSSWIPRLLPKGVRYEGRVHEQPVSPLPHRPIDIALRHDGYLAEHLERKAGRNEALLLAELEVRPGDAYLWFQLGKEYAVRGQPPQAGVCLTEALRLTPAGAPWRHALVVRAITALKSAERLDEALALADAEINAWQGSPDFFFAVGDLYLECATRQPDRAASDFLPVVELAWKKCLEIGEAPHLDGAVAGRGSHMAAHNLAVFYETLGREDLAADYQQLAAALRKAA